MSVAREARVRVHDVSPQHAGTDLAASVVGRLYLAKKLEPEQINAARLFADTYAAYQRAMDSPRPPKAVNIGGASAGAPPDVTPEQSERARGQWRSICIVLLDANLVHRAANIYAACDYLVLRDVNLEHLIGDLRLGLNAIAHAYGLAKAAA